MTTDFLPPPPNMSPRPVHLEEAWTEGARYRLYDPRDAHFQGSYQTFMVQRRGGRLVFWNETERQLYSLSFRGAHRLIAEENLSS